MKVKVLTRNPNDYLRETKKDIHKMQRNYDPSLHPMETAREYTQALNATKLERVFAKPYVGCLDGHSDGVHTMAKHPFRLSMLASGAYDGEIRTWDLATRTCTTKIDAHTGFVRGLVYNTEGTRLISCGDDKIIKTWDPDSEDPSMPVHSVTTENILQGMAHHQTDDIFATCGSCVEVWNYERAEPTRVFNWGIDTITSIAFNPVETNLMAATAYDRSIALYDSRGSQPLRKITLRMRSNMIRWNPMEAYHFTIANEDFNLYTFDMRFMRHSKHMHCDHTGPVMDLDFSPTGKEFVSAGYDKTIRIHRTTERNSREIYHTKRMQKVLCVRWSADNKYILSGSDEMNIRLWKANASEKLGLLKPRERAAFQHSEKLKEKFSHHPDIARIKRHRHVPKSVKFNAQNARAIRESERRKDDRRFAHSGQTKEKQATVIKEDH